MSALLDVERQTSLHNVAMPCNSRDASSPATLQIIKQCFIKGVPCKLWWLMCLECCSRYHEGSGFSMLISSSGLAGHDIRPCD
jgi:hypothetical protein